MAEKSYLLAPQHAEAIERKWGGSTYTTVAEVHAKIVALLKEYVESGDNAETYLCIRELNGPFFHHEVVKKALVLAMEEEAAEAKILSSLMRECRGGANHCKPNVQRFYKDLSFHSRPST